MLYQLHSLHQLATESLATSSIIAQFLKALQKVQLYDLFFNIFFNVVILYSFSVVLSHTFQLYILNVAELHIHMYFQFLKIGGLVHQSNTIVFSGFSSDIKSQNIPSVQLYLLSIDVTFLEAESCHLE
jgi:hypothetical protein